MTSFDGWDNELYHHGIKGQKWGVRRTLEELGHITENTGKAANSVQNLNRLGSKRQENGDDPSKMSDDELRRRLNRLNMERQYKDLTSSKERSKGFEVFKETVALIGSLSAIGVSALAIYEGVKANRQKK